MSDWTIRFRMVRVLLVSAVVAGGWAMVFTPTAASAACALEREPPGEPQLFIRRLRAECSKRDRAAYPVEAADVLTALKAGKGVALHNVVLRGNLLLTQLPSVPLDFVNLPESVLSRLKQTHVSDVRVIAGPLLIQNSIVEGNLDSQFKPNMVEHRVLGDMMVIQGPVSFKGTTFKKDVDLSRTVFLDTVDSAEAVYLGDTFFLTCIFTKPATFEKTAFAANTRFYQTVFDAPVTFLRAGFSGLTNFLSVQFHKEVSFSRAYFKMGTGFSGSRFEGISDFSEAVFEKAAFFMHTTFASDVYFRRATFRGETDFSNAAFHGKDDFAKVFYSQEPNFTHAIFESPRSRVGFENPLFLMIVGVSLLIFLVAFVILLRKG